MKTLIDEALAKYRKELHDAKVHDVYLKIKTIVRLTEDFRDAKIKLEKIGVDLTKEMIDEFSAVDSSVYIDEDYKE